MCRFLILVCGLSFLVVGSLTSSSTDESGKDDVAVTVENGEQQPPVRVLNPTSEWQKVEDGMAIPPGLHVRMDLQTGVKEAKLLDPGDAKPGSANEIHVLPRDQREGIVNTKRMVMSRAQVAEQLAEVQGPSTTPAGLTYEADTPDEGSNSKPNIADQIIRTRAAMKKKLPRAEVEIMQELVKVLANSSSTLEQRKTALDELEFYVHQIDNARDLNAIGGLVLVVRALNDSDRDMRGLAALTLGGAMQGNREVQGVCLKYGSLPLLLRLVNEHDQPVVQRRALFAISALVRSFLPGQAALWKLGGLTHLQQLCVDWEKTRTLCTKAVTLLYDLIAEEKEAFIQEDRGSSTGSKSDLPKESLLYHLESDQLCEAVTLLLRDNDVDVVEKGLIAMEAMLPACGNRYSGQMATIQRLQQLQQQWTASQNADSTDSYFSSLLEVLSRVQSQLKYCKTAQNCSLTTFRTAKHTEL